MALIAGYTYILRTVVLLFSLIVDVRAPSCYYTFYSTTYSQKRDATKYCESCCGTYGNQDCCTDGTENGLIIGIIAAVVVIIILCLGLTVCCMKHKSETRVSVFTPAREEIRIVHESHVQRRSTRNPPQYISAPPGALYGGHGDLPPAYISAPGAYEEAVGPSHHSPHSNIGNGGGAGPSYNSPHSNAGYGGGTGPSYNSLPSNTLYNGEAGPLPSKH